MAPRVSGSAQGKKLTWKRPTSKRSLPLVSLASGYCFLSDSKRPAPERKSGMPVAVEMPAPGCAGGGVSRLVGGRGAAGHERRGVLTAHDCDALCLEDCAGDVMDVGGRGGRRRKRGRRGEGRGARGRGRGATGGGCQRVELAKVDAASGGGWAEEAAGRGGMAGGGLRAIQSASASAVSHLCEGVGGKSARLSEGKRGRKGEEQGEEEEIVDRGGRRRSTDKNHTPRASAMSIDVDWSALDAQLTLSCTRFLSQAFAQATTPDFVGPLAVTHFSFGDALPQVTLDDIRDIQHEFLQPQDLDPGSQVDDDDEGG